MSLSLHEQQQQQQQSSAPSTAHTQHTLGSLPSQRVKDAPAADVRWSASSAAGAVTTLALLASLAVRPALRAQAFPRSSTASPPIDPNAPRSQYSPSIGHSGRASPLPGAGPDASSGELLASAVRAHSRPSLQGTGPASFGSFAPGEAAGLAAAQGASGAGGGGALQGVGSSTSSLGSLGGASLSYNGTAGGNSSVGSGSGVGRGYGRASFKLVLRGGNGEGPGCHAATRGSAGLAARSTRRVQLCRAAGSRRSMRRVQLCRAAGSRRSTRRVKLRRSVVLID